jgi:hypothetical protein
MLLTTILPNFNLFKLLARKANSLKDLPTAKDSISDFDVLGLNHRSTYPISRETISETVEAILSGEGFSRTLFFAAKKNLARSGEANFEFHLQKEGSLELDLFDTFGLHYCGSKNGLLFVSRIPNDSLKLGDDDDKSPRPVKGFKLSPDKEVQIGDLVYRGLDNGKKLKVSSTGINDENPREIQLIFTGPQYDSLQTPEPLTIHLKVA